MTAHSVRVERSRPDQDDLQARREHCSLDHRLLDELGIAPGRQVRLVHPDAGPALFTVSEERLEAEPTVVRAGLTGRRRLGTDGPFPAVVDLRVPDPYLSERQARDRGELIERLDDAGATHVAVLAPHGGGIEPFTDRQAELVGLRLGPDRATVWRCKGWWPDASFERWHITSTDIEPRSFPRLREIRDRGFDHAVAFHGMEQPGVLVGGLAPLEVRQALVAAIAAVVACSGIEVRLAADDGFNGNDPRNIVNRLTGDRRGGVQIEQSAAARSLHADAIAHAVAGVYAQPPAPGRP